MENFSSAGTGSIHRIRGRFNKNYYEEAAWVQNQVICGLDEVGRGCLAGPVVTAAVILPIGKTHRLLKDSKLMTPEEREKAYGWIIKNCWYATGIVHHRLIDNKNVYHATLMGMKKALVHLMATAPVKPVQIITDAMPLNLFDTAYKDIPVHYFPFGERRSNSIAAASIVAKVTRDAMMRRMDTIFPGYLLASHKGYSTPPHKRIIREGKQHLIIHRDSFLNRLDAIEEDDLENQSSFPFVSSERLCESRDTLKDFSTQPEEASLGMPPIAKPASKRSARTEQSKDSPREPI